MDTTIIIRSANERTENLCFELIKTEFPESSVFFSRRVPFAATLKESLEIGLREGRKWTLHIDADVLPVKDAIKQLIDVANSLPDHIMEVQGLILDKFFPIKRPAGNHLYRTRYIETVLKNNFIEAHVQRPESNLLRKMAQLGYPSYQTDILIGLHDFEQYYEDIFRKCMLQVIKTSWAAIQLEKYWMQQLNFDKDFWVALLAKRIVDIGVENASTNKLQNSAEIKLFLKHCGIIEKLKPESFDVINLFSKTLAEFENDHFLIQLQEEMMPASKLNSIIHQLNTKNDQRNLQRSFLLRLGSFVEKVGRNIKLKV